MIKVREAIEETQRRPAFQGRENRCRPARRDTARYHGRLLRDHRRQQLQKRLALGWAR